MNAVRLHKQGGAESLLCDDAPIPWVNEDQVLIRVDATAITRTAFDWYPTFHTPNGGARPFPIILGHEFSGVIEAIGAACEGLQIRETVYGMSDWFIDDAQAEYCLTIPANVVLDTVGGNTRERSWGVLRKSGPLVTIAADAEGVKEQRVHEAFFIVEPNRNQLMDFCV